MLKKVAAWTTALSLLVLIITWGVMGFKIFSGDYDIEPLAYIGAACWVVLLVSIIALRWNSWKCPHCGKIRWTNGRYCSHCGKEIK